MKKNYLWYCSKLWYSQNSIVSMLRHHQRKKTELGTGTMQIASCC